MQSFFSFLREEQEGFENAQSLLEKLDKEIRAKIKSYIPKNVEWD